MAILAILASDALYIKRLAVHHGRSVILQCVGEMRRYATLLEAIKHDGNSLKEMSTPSIARQALNE